LNTVRTAVLVQKKIDTKNANREHAKFDHGVWPSASMSPTVEWLQWFSFIQA